MDIPPPRPPNAPKGTRPNLFKRKYLINPKFQLGFTLGFGVLFLMSNLLLYIGVMSVFDSMTDIPEGIPPEQAEIFYSFLAAQRSELSGIFLSEAVWLAVFMFFAGIILSHRVAGPIHRLKTHFNRLTETESLDDLKFREGDFFQDVPPPVNRFLSAMRSRLQGPPRG